MNSLNKRKNINYKELILKTLFIGGVISLAVIAPNALACIKKLNLDPYEKSQRKKYIKSKINEMVQKGLIEFKVRGGKKFVKITKAGEGELQKYLLNDLEIKKPKKWDGKWRIVTFDVKVGKGKLRDLLRFHLKRLGFVQFQQSIWIYPYECEEIIILLKSHLKFGKEVLYARAEYIENDFMLKEKFKI